MIRGKLSLWLYYDLNIPKGFYLIFATVANRINVTNGVPRVVNSAEALPSVNTPLFFA